MVTSQSRRRGGVVMLLLLLVTAVADVRALKSYHSSGDEPTLPADASKGGFDGFGRTANRYASPNNDNDNDEDYDYFNGDEDVEQDEQDDMTGGRSVVERVADSPAFPPRAKGDPYAKVYGSLPQSNSHLAPDDSSAPRYFVPSSSDGDKGTRYFNVPAERLAAANNMIDNDQSAPDSSATDGEHARTANTPAGTEAGTSGGVIGYGVLGAVLGMAVVGLGVGGFVVLKRRRQQRALDIVDHSDAVPYENNSSSYASKVAASAGGPTISVVPHKERPLMSASQKQHELNVGAGGGARIQPISMPHLVTSTGPGPASSNVAAAAPAPALAAVSESAPTSSSSSPSDSAASANSGSLSEAAPAAPRASITITARKK